MNASSRLVAAMLALASLTVVGSAVAATLAVADGAPASLRVPFRLICHGLAERCFVIGGVPMPICARCTAIWGGLLLGTAIFALFWKSIPDVPLGALGVAVLPLVIDGGTQALGLRESTNGLRALTGAVAGTAFALWALSTLQKSSGLTSPRNPAEADRGIAEPP